MTAVANGQDAVAVLAARWLDLAGERLARDVATGKVCDRCARAALLTIGVAGGIPPVTLAREGLHGYERKLHGISAAVARLLELDDEAGAA